MNTRAAIYARISEADDRLGVERQLKLCRERAVSEGWDATEFVDNSRSAYSGKTRPGYEAMLRAIAGDGFAVVLVYHVDRLFRRDRERLRFYDVLMAASVARVASIDGQDVDLKSADGRRLFRDLGSAAEYESDRKGERVRRKIDQLREGGYWTGGGRPFGFDVVQDGAGKVLHVRADEAAALRDAYQALRNGRSLKGAARDLAGAGFTTSRGNAWNGNTLKQTLLAERNVGAIVDRRTWNAVRDELQDPARDAYRSRGDRYLLSGGIARCAADGDALVGRPVGGKRSYVCQHGGHVHLGIRADALERFVLEAADEMTVTAVKVADPAKLNAGLLAEADRLERELEEIGETDLPVATIRGRARKLQAQLDDVTAKLEVSAVQITSWEDLYGPSDPRTFVEGRVDRVDVAAVGKGGKHRPIGGRVTIRWRRGVRSAA